MELLNDVNTWLNEFLMNAGVLAPIFCCILIFLEGTLAFLPLFLFITVNILTLGPVIGCLVSWICTTLGSFTMFCLSRKLFNNFIQKKSKKKKYLRKIVNAISNLSFAKLALIIAIPFAPSFFINLGAGVSKIPKKKYLYSLLVGKVFIVIFWGYIGSNIIECLKNPILIIKVVIMLLVAYGLSQFINKKFNIDERF